MKKPPRPWTCIRCHLLNWPDLKTGHQRPNCHGCGMSR